MRSVRGRSASEGGEIPAVALTAFATAQDRIRTFDAGFDVHVPKPVDVKELVSVVRHLVRAPARTRPSER
jgi:DNA-binding response OmpR family regulator